MIGSLRKLLRGQRADARESAGASVPDGQRVFAIGDIHGRLDLFSALIAAIDAIDAPPKAVATSIILLGDLIDRGPSSAGVLERARRWQQQRVARGDNLHIIMGNHEEMLLDALDDLEVLRYFLSYGGRETVLSFGVSEIMFEQASLTDIQSMLRAAMEPRWRTFVENFESIVRIGDYAFVHAGVRPDRPLDEQKTSDMRWIREPFLSSTGNHGAVIVHGHTISAEPVFRHNRIGIDTGAYASGRLTALMLEGTAQRWIVAEERDGAIATSVNAA